MTKTRFGIVGTSGHASRVVAPVLKRNPEVSLLAAVALEATATERVIEKVQRLEALQEIDSLCTDLEGSAAP